MSLITSIRESFESLPFKLFPVSIIFKAIEASRQSYPELLSSSWGVFLRSTTTKEENRGYNDTTEHNKFGANSVQRLLHQAKAWLDT
jgi:hypothetical protein